MPASQKTTLLSARNSKVNYLTVNYAILPYFSNPCEIFYEAQRATLYNEIFLLLFSLFFHSALNVSPDVICICFSYTVHRIYAINLRDGVSCFKEFI